MNFPCAVMFALILLTCSSAAAQSFNRISMDSVRKLREIRNIQQGKDRLQHFLNTKDPERIKSVDLRYAPIEEFPEELFDYDSLHTLNLSFTSIRN